ncbi:MAG: hypothetical protein JWL92_607, partial [Candidatus Nomurabacteria bacterium]|nr:hypothetical protein [Candidatus Nomurabacteria bacterium]
MNERQIIILVITKTEGAGARTIARQLVHAYGYKHYSVRDYLIKKYTEIRVLPPEHQEELEEFATKQRKKNGVEDIINPLIIEILNSKEGTFFVLESVLCLGELIHIKKVCNRKKNVRLVLVALDAPAEIRRQRLAKHADFKGKKTLERLLKIYVPPTTDYFQAVKWYEQADNCPEKINVQKCLKYVPKAAHFQNLEGEQIQTARKMHLYA